MKFSDEIPGNHDDVPVLNCVTVLLQAAIQLSKVMNGFLLGFVLLIIAVMKVVYSYICTVIEYEDREF